MGTSRDCQWLRWMVNVKDRLIHMENRATDPAVSDFFAWHYAGHHPAKFRAPISPSMFWTPDSLVQKLGQGLVEVQVNRVSNPEYEPQSNFHKYSMPFDVFMNDMMARPGNDVYMTANNSGANRNVLAGLAGDLLPLPNMLNQTGEQAMLWIGRDTQTPIHHDLTQNLLVEHYGTKRVMTFPPSDTPMMDNYLHVYSRHRWLTLEQAKNLGLNPRVYDLNPGEALFLPVGWWHQVEGFGVCVMTSHTNFIWPNDNWGANFPVDQPPGAP